jgi:hypothetical protein
LQNDAILIRLLQGVEGMQKWEYILIIATEDEQTVATQEQERKIHRKRLANTLNELGEEGWDVTGTWATNEPIIIMKRVKAQPSQPTGAPPVRNLGSNNPS